MNSEGIPRDQLVWALTNPLIVREYRRIKSCMLCRRPEVNEAAICPVCWVLLDSHEFDLAHQWVTGERF